MYLWFTVFTSDSDINNVHATVNRELVRVDVLMLLRLSVLTRQHGNYSQIITKRS